jgi:hypothetical protein
MRRYLLPPLFAVALAVSIAATSQGAKGPVTFKVTLVQEATIRHAHPPVGDAGDTFSTVLKLNAIGSVLGLPNGTPMGSMAFTWGPLNGSCSSNAAECSGTTNILTLTKLPGGTITANGIHISLANGIILPVQSGTGIFTGVKGTVFVAPGGDHVDVFKLQMP